MQSPEAQYALQNHLVDESTAHADRMWRVGLGLLMLGSSYLPTVVHAEPLDHIERTLISELPGRQYCISPNTNDYSAVTEAVNAPYPTATIIDTGNVD